MRYYASRFEGGDAQYWIAHVLVAKPRRLAAAIYNPTSSYRFGRKYLDNIMQLLSRSWRRAMMYWLTMKLGRSVSIGGSTVFNLIGQPKTGAQEWKGR